MRLQKILLCAVALCAVCLMSAAAAEGGNMVSGQVHPSLPYLNVSVADTGERLPGALRERVLSVSVQAVDGSFSQTLSYLSSEDPSADHLSLMARFEDMNFDGYQDLVLLTAQGARNCFTALSLWDQEEGCFQPVLQSCTWEREARRWSESPVQLELCNYELLPESRRILSVAEDGFRFRQETVYAWEGRYSPETKAVLDVYDAGAGTIGESLVLFATAVTCCWDEQYPEEWYYGQSGVDAERQAAAREMMLGRAVWDGEHLRVANVDWVNLRQQDSKSSPSLAELDAGTTVTMLASGLGTDGGWVRVWYMPDPSSAEDGVTGLTGYIWHSYLEPDV